MKTKADNEIAGLSPRLVQYQIAIEHWPMRGLTKKLDYEKGKLRSRSAKADYRERFADEGDRFDRGGSVEPDRLDMKALLAGDLRPELRFQRMKALAVFESKIRGVLVRVNQWKLRLRFTPAQFAAENGIPLLQAEGELPNVKVIAEEYLRMTLQRMRRAQFCLADVAHPKTGKMRRILCLRFRTFLQPVEPIDWRKSYTRLLLDPVENEPDERMGSERG